MSLYNMLFGKNPFSVVLLKMLNLTEDDCGRFRDAFINENGNIVVCTRNGGGNRECWDWAEEYGGDSCNCPGCVITNLLPEHPNYIKDYDDDFDCTYAYIEFSVPDVYKELIEALRSGKEDTLVGEKFKALIDRLGG